MRPDGIATAGDLACVSWLFAAGSYPAPATGGGRFIGGGFPTSIICGFVPDERPFSIGLVGVR